MDAAGIAAYELEVTDSEVYGAMIDVLVGGAEVCSAGLGPHPLDGNWGIVDPWVGLGFGLERLLMTREGYPNIERAAVASATSTACGSTSSRPRAETASPAPYARGAGRPARPSGCTRALRRAYLPSSASIFLTPSLASSA